MKKNGHLIKLPDTVYQTDQWSGYLWKQHIDRSAEIRGVIEKGEEKIFNFPSFTREVFHRLYADNAKKLDTVKPEHDWAERAHSELDELPAFELLGRRCKGDKFLAGVAATAFSERVLEELPLPVEKLEDPEPLRGQIQGLMSFAENLDDEQSEEVQQLIDNLREQGKQAVEAALEYASGLDSSVVRRALRSACTQAHEQVDEVMEQLAAFTDWGEQAGVEQASAAVKMELSNRLKRSSRLQRLAREAGRLRRIAAAKQRSKANHARDEVTDVELGADLDRVLPCELVKLTDATLALDFARRFMERGLLQYRLAGKEIQGRGPVIVCLDSSSSMEGPKEIWAKALALALLQIATDQGRNCRVVYFNSGVERVDDWLSGKVDISALLASMEYFPGGGTDFKAPLSTALEAIEQETKLKKADVVLVTDGECEVSDGFVELWNSAKVKHEFTTYAVHIDAPSGVVPAVLNKIADTVVGLPDLRDDGTTTDAVLTI